MKLVVGLYDTVCFQWESFPFRKNHITFLEFFYGSESDLQNKYRPTHPNYSIQVFKGKKVLLREARLDIEKHISENPKILETYREYKINKLLN